MTEVIWLAFSPPNRFIQSRDRRQHVVRAEGLEQLHPDDGEVLRFRAQWARDQVVVDLAGAENDAADLVAMLLHQRVVDQPSEAMHAQVFEPRPGGPQSQQALGSHDDQRPRPAMQGLAPQRVEIVRRGARIEDPDVAFGGKLEETFQPRARMLGTAAFVTMGKEKGESR